MTLTFGSLFAGIGGMDLGLERAGMVCKWQVEIDPWCRRVLAKHWPDVPKYGDIREVTGEELGHVDLICGGFPCQDISGIGSRVGIDGERSGLWSEYIRLVRVVRPRYVLVENVAALLDRGIERVLGDLAASGYDAEWDGLPASSFGAPHRRDRIFVLAYPSGGPGRSKDSALSKQFGSFRSGAGNRKALSRSDWWASEPAVDRVVDGVPYLVDRARGLGNAVVPQVAEWLGRRILEAS